MKRIFRFAYIALAAVLVTAISSCTKEYEYDPAIAEGAQVYFDQDQASTIEVTKDKNSFTIPIYRVNTQGSLTVPLQFTADAGNIYTLPSQVTFPDGQSSTLITVTYDPAKVEYGTYLGGKLSVADAKYTTPYGFPSMTFKAGATEWVSMLVDGKPATATYREDLVTGMFAIDNLVYQVPIEMSKVRPGMYRLVNPYGQLYPYNAEGDYDATKNHYMVINAIDPNYVYVEEFHSGMDWSYGEFSFISKVAYWIMKGQATLEQVKQSHPEVFGKLEGGVITMPAKSMLLNLAVYNPTGWYTSNPNGLFAVALPGHNLADYTTTFEYIGRFTSVNDADFAQGVVTLGPDAVSAKVALVPEGGDVNAAVTGIINGSVSSVEVLKNGQINLPFTDSGNYTVVIVVYNAAGDAVKVYTQNITLKSSKENVEQFVDIAGGVLTLGANDMSPLISSDGNPWGLLLQDTPLPIEAVLSQSKSDPTHFQLTPWIPMDGGKPLDFYWNQQTGVVTVDNCSTGIETNGGFIYATDAMSYSSSYFTGKNVDSKYDNATQTFHFFLLYTGADYTGMYAFEEETFAITATAAKAMKKAVERAKNASSTTTSFSVSPQKHYSKKLIKPNVTLIDFINN